MDTGAPGKGWQHTRVAVVAASLHLVPFDGEYLKPS